MQSRPQISEEQFERSLQVFAQSQEIWQRLQVCEVNSKEWNELRAKHTALRILHHDIINGISTIIN